MQGWRWRIISSGRDDNDDADDNDNAGEEDVPAPATPPGCGVAEAIMEVLVISLKFASAKKLLAARNVCQ